MAGTNAAANATAKVLIAAGGTGGHIFPGLAIADELRAAGAAVVWCGAGGMEETLVKKHGLPLYTVPYRSPSATGSRGSSGGLRLAAAVWKARRLLGVLRPSAVLCMGGYACVPAGLAAVLRRLPLFVHEQNAVPGRATRLLALFARAVLTGFPPSDVPPAARQENGKRRYVGNPVRREFLNTAARARGGIGHVLVLGGSQGAAVFNKIVPPAAVLFAREASPLRITHHCGRGNAAETEAAYAAVNAAAEGNGAALVNVAVREFIDDVAAAMAAADIVICRAGAATLAELAAAAVGAIFVPYPHAAADHQTANARRFCARGAGLLCPQQTLTPENLAAQLLNIHREKRAGELAQNAAALAKPQAAKLAAQICLQGARRVS